MASTNITLQKFLQCFAKFSWFILRLSISSKSYADVSILKRMTSLSSSHVLSRDCPSMVLAIVDVISYECIQSFDCHNDRHAELQMSKKPPKFIKVMFVHKIDGWTI